MEGSLEDPAELLFHQAVLETELLLFPERDRVVRLFAAGSFRTVHSRRIIFPLERFGRSEKRHAVSAGNFVLGPVYLAMATVNRKWLSPEIDAPLFRRAATVVRHRCNVADNGQVETNCLERTNG